MSAVATSTWGFLTNHALVLVHVVCHPDSTVRDIAGGAGITERATLAILRQLVDDGIVERQRRGRRNTYSVNFDRLAAYRREGTVALTPRVFIDALIRMLLELSRIKPQPSADGSMFDSGALEPRLGTWGFLTNHSLVLLAIAMDPDSTVREVAASVGVTERAVVAILNQLESEGVVVRTRAGRRNLYRIDLDALREFPRWSPGDWEFPPQLIDVAVNGLGALMSDDRRGEDGAP